MRRSLSLRKIFGRRPSRVFKDSLGSWIGRNEKAPKTQSFKIGKGEED